ncbi:MalY/PatB family protein [Helcococcus kunzii]|uniref:MalY/PatB family protein n=1 Tax=Helcococcus kunzii TaxID=40091 RepID=UPI0038A78575
MYKNFENKKLINTRISTNSKKWSRYTNETIPFWIADMDFKSPEFLVKDIIERAKKNYFGYTDIPKELKDNIYEWYKITKHVEINKEDIIFSTSVLNSYETILDAFLEKNDKILFFTPIYTQLMNIATKNYNLVEYDMEEYPYTIDFDLLEKKLDELEEIKSIILCNPHNPIGKLWTETELLKLTSICRERNILLISDEIHSDLIYENEVFISLCCFMEEYDDKMFVLSSPGKTFNVSGFKAAYIISSSKSTNYVRSKIKEKRYNEIDIFSLVAMNSLYKNRDLSLEWLNNINGKIENNYKIVKNYLKESNRVYIPEVQSTYLIWIKIENSSCKNSEEMRKILIEKYSIDLHEGTIFGSSGKYYLRMNIACPKNILIIGLKRLKLALDNNDI